MPVCGDGEGAQQPAPDHELDDDQIALYQICVHNSSHEFWMRPAECDSTERAIVIYSYKIIEK